MPARPPPPATSPIHPAVGTLIDGGALQLVEVLGVGGYGVVYRAVDPRHPSKSYAVKRLVASGHQSRRQRQMHTREAALHQLASAHHGVVTLHRVIDEGNHSYIVMDYAADHDLFTQIVRKRRYLGQGDLIKDIFLQLIDAVQYCHSLGIYHRDLKPENILCFDGGLRVAVTDFGLATTDQISVKFRTGSETHMSPECQGGEHSPTGHYSPMFNDIWSLGIILINLATGRNPWKSATPGDPTFQAYLRDPEGFLPTVLPISPEVNAILVRMLDVDWRERANLSEVRHAIERVSSFYSEHVIFEGSRARCSWKSGMEFDSAPSGRDVDGGPALPRTQSSHSDDASRRLASPWSKDSASDMVFAAPSFTAESSYGQPWNTYSAHGATVSIPSLVRSGSMSSESSNGHPWSIATPSLVAGGSTSPSILTSPPDAAFSSRCVSIASVESSDHHQLRSARNWFLPRRFRATLYVEEHPVKNPVQPMVSSVSVSSTGFVTSDAGASPLSRLASMLFPRKSPPSTPTNPARAAFSARLSSTALSNEYHQRRSARKWFLPRRFRHRTTYHIEEHILLHPAKNSVQPMARSVPVSLTGFMAPVAGATPPQLSRLASMFPPPNPPPFTPTTPPDLEHSARLASASEPPHAPLPHCEAPPLPPQPPDRNHHAQVMPRSDWHGQQQKGRPGEANTAECATPPGASPSEHHQRFSAQNWFPPGQFKFETEVDIPISVPIEQDIELHCAHNPADPLGSNSDTAFSTGPMTQVAGMFDYDNDPADYKPIGFNAVAAALASQSLSFQTCTSSTGSHNTSKSSQWTCTSLVLQNESRKTGGQELICSITPPSPSPSRSLAHLLSSHDADTVSLSAAPSSNFQIVGHKLGGYHAISDASGSRGFRSNSRASVIGSRNMYAASHRASTSFTNMKGPGGSHEFIGFNAVAAALASQSLSYDSCNSSAGSGDTEYSSLYRRRTLDSTVEW